MINRFGVFVTLAMYFWHISALTPEQKAQIQTTLFTGGVECIQKHPLSVSDIRSFQKKMLPDKKEARCFAACLFKKIGLMNAMGKLDAEKGAANAAHLFKDSDKDMDNTKMFFQECLKVNDEKVSDGSKGCDRAKLAFNCLKNNAPKYGFDVEL